MDLSDITVLILTFNEENNISRTLRALGDFPEVLVIDSGSNDQTASAVAEFKNARIITRKFDTHANQWNYGLSCCNADRAFVLALDADYRITPEFVQELLTLNPAPEVGGYRVSFRYCVHGRPLKGSLYPPTLALFRRNRAHYVQTGHTQRVFVSGSVGEIQSRIFHDDRKPLSRWVASQVRYAQLEAQYLIRKEPAELRTTDRLRLACWPAPLLVFGYVLIVKGCILDGWRGWFYLYQRVFAEALLALELMELRSQVDLDRTEPTSQALE